MKFNMNWIALLAALASCSSSAPAQEASGGQTVLVEFTVMNDGAGQAERDTYIRKTAPVLKRHGMKALDTYTISQRMMGTGPEHPLQLMLWGLETPDAVQEVMGDPRYQAHVAFRDKTHNMGALTMYVARQTFDAGGTSLSNPVMIELVVMNEGYGQKERDEYYERTKDIAGKYGMRKFRSYQLVRYMSGTGPKNAIELNLWELSSADAMQKIGADPDYQANVAFRDKIHDMPALTLYMARLAHTR